MRLYRLTKARHANEAFTGEGALLYGGRWNSKGHACVYLAESVALCQLETLVHLSDPEEINSFILYSLDVPDEWVTELTLDALPADWNNIVPPPALKQLGNGWLTSQVAPVLLVPSVLSPTERNALFNPNHPEAKFILERHLDGQPFIMDARLFRRPS